MAWYWFVAIAVGWACCGVHVYLTFREHNSHRSQWTTAIRTLGLYLALLGPLMGIAFMLVPKAKVGRPARW